MGAVPAYWILFEVANLICSANYYGFSQNNAGFHSIFLVFVNTTSVKLQLKELLQLFQNLFVNAYSPHAEHLNFATALYDMRIVNGGVLISCEYVSYTASPLHSNSKHATSST